MSYDIKIHFDSHVSSGYQQDQCQELSKNLFTSFCNEFPAHYIDYLRPYREKYCSNILSIYEDFNQLYVNEHSPHVNIIHEHYFKKFCGDMEKIVGKASSSQHFLMFILSCDVTQWNFYTKEQDEQFYFTLKGGQFENALVPQQLSLLSALFESSLLSIIYPNIQCSKISLEGSLFIPLHLQKTHFTFSKIYLHHGIVNTKYCFVCPHKEIKNLTHISEFDSNINWEPSILDFSYYHKPFCSEDLHNKNSGGVEFIINSLYGEKQKEVLSLFHFIKLKQELPFQEKTILKNKI